MAVYTKQPWVDNVTPVDATRMLHIEDGIYNLSTAPPAVDLNYRGDWAAGSYVDGDIVVYQGVSYMAVKPTSAAPVAWPRPTPQATYGTSLPSSPYDGQEAVLVADVASGIMWRFRYNASSASAYKWEFIGGPPMFTRQSAIHASITSTAFIDLQNIAPITVARAGEYQHTIWLNVTAATANAADFLVSLYPASTIGWMSATTTTTGLAVPVTGFLSAGWSAGTAVKLQVRTTVAAAVFHAQLGALTILPMRVS